ncbi:hypothetical protein LTR95_009970 [Oleoguttula sp. CCFEE 5521]
MTRHAHLEKNGTDSTQPARQNYGLSRQQIDAASFGTQTSHEGTESPAADNDEEPPPAYGDTDSDLHVNQDGLDTSARVTDDGRINIRINQLNRRLSQILTPALRQTAADLQDTPLPSPAADTLKPPSLNVVIQVVGSRGDVQPFVALGKVLKEIYGHRVRVATHPNFQRFVEDHGLEFFNIGGDPAKLMAYMVKNPALMPGFWTLVSGDVGERRQDVGEYIQGCWRSCYEAGNGMQDNASEDDPRPFVADCIIANPPSFAHIHCAEKLGIPVHIMFTMPYSQTQSFAHPLANIQSSNADPQVTNYISYAMIEVMSWQGVGVVINRFRAKCLGLDPVSVTWAPGMLQRLKIPHTYFWSPALVPKPKDWASHISVPGFAFLATPAYEPAADLVHFLESGPTPTYIGFGSIVLEDPDAMNRLVFEAAKLTGQRVLLSKGWGGMGGMSVPDGVFMLEDVPHDWLFKRVSCVVHHGGAGTTAAGIAAGRPTLVVPFFGDQHFWGAMIARAGSGPRPIPHKRLTAAGLSEAIRFCLLPSTVSRAKELAGKIASERGTATGAESFHQHLNVDRLRCTLAPDRVAAWRIRHTRVRLSAFAACTLVNENLLDFKDLKLYRSREYETDEGPWDPISGGFVAACGAFSDMGMGLAKIPTEAYKAARVTYKSSQGRSKASALITSSDQASLDGKHGVMKLPGPSSGTSIDSSNPERKQSDRLRHTSAHASKGLGRFTKALVQSPMDVAMGLTKGSNNVARLWGDDTVRPNYQVHDFSSGATAAGKGFGLGLYDGITGLVMQPLKGAQQQGFGGFCKGMGKGVGGMLTKPTAGAVGVLGYTMKGVHKGMQNLYRDNVGSHIVSSRMAQGYEDWRQSSESERQDVIARWELAQKFLKKKQSPDDMMQDALAAQRRDLPGQHSVTPVAAHELSSTTTSREASPTTLASSTRSSLETLKAKQHHWGSFDGTSRTSLDSEGDAELKEAMDFSMQSATCVPKEMLLGEDLREAIRRSLEPQ